MNSNALAHRSRLSPRLTIPRAGWLGVTFAALALTACAGQPLVSPYPDMAQTPQPPQNVLTPEQRDAQIEDLQDEAKRNAARGGL